MEQPAAELLAARAKRVKDAYELRRPDRVPIALNFGYLLARLGGITNQELEHNTDQAQELLEQCALRFEPDVISGLGFLPHASIALGDRQTQWAGYGLDANGTFQYVEGEYMKANEYDAFLNDPTDFTLRTFMPRAFSELEGLATLPRLSILLLGYSSLRMVRAFSTPMVVTALEALMKAGQEVEKLGAVATHGKQRMESLGFPMSFGTSSLITAPFDFMSDTLRGMRGIMLDMFRCPDKLLAAMQKVVPIVVDYAVTAAKRTAVSYCSIPLHRGSDGFMSIKQFEKFYWPSLKEMLFGLIEAGVTPSIFYEGVYDQRLGYLRELPKGKTIGRFDRSDMFQVKEVVGDIMCIQGGFPVSLLQAGSREQIRELTKKMCEVVGKDGGFIMGPSTTISESDPELVKIWVDATREYGTYS